MLWSVVTSGVQSRAVLVSPSSSALSCSYQGCNLLSSIADIKWVLWWPQYPLGTVYRVGGHYPLVSIQGAGDSSPVAVSPASSGSSIVSRSRRLVTVQTTCDGQYSLITGQPQVTGARYHLLMNSNIFIRY